jgi:hypothetical protein
MTTSNSLTQQLAQELVESVKFEGRFDWDDLWGTRTKVAQLVTLLGGQGYLVEKMNPGEVALYIAVLRLANE